MRLYRDKRGAGGYVLYPSGAKKLLKYQQKNGIAPVDWHLNDCPTLRYQIEPACVVQAICAQEYGMKQHSLAVTQTSIKHRNNQTTHVIVRRKRIIAQIKSGLRKLGFIFKTGKKRHIELNNQDFE